ncbi:MAG: GTPase HflX [Burkholderiaceae bacterium]|nr:GTPase HflX [Burkholderiaceae bacterium]
MSDLGSVSTSLDVDFSRNPRTVLVALTIGSGPAPDLGELQALAESAGARVVQVVTGRRDRPDPALFVGSGKAEDIVSACAEHQAELVIFDHTLSPGQQRNLSKLLKRRVIDRVALILDIFALRARSHEGKLQVELAQLDYLSARLVRGWTHLERQKGGIGLRGPGETQLETDRRLIGQRVKQLKLRLSAVEKQRKNRMRHRHRQGAFAVSLVGYTNAGKSTLFNALTHAGVYAADQLFATLDTTSRRVFLAPGEFMVLSDTVGFIRELPHSLIEAFKSTLHEAADADLLLHVIDASDPDRELHKRAVDQVLAEVGAADVPRIEVMNKIDLAGVSCRSESDPEGRIRRVWLSAQTGLGLDALREAVRSHVPAFPSPDPWPGALSDNLGALQPSVQSLL